MMPMEFLIRLTVLHNPLHFSGSLKRCVLALIVGTLIVPAVCTGLPGENGSISGLKEEKQNLSITQPTEGFVYWLDVWPMKAVITGNYVGQYSLEGIEITTQSGITKCGNSTKFYCEAPAQEGANRITITAIDTKGNRVSETRNFTVNAGGPPPPPLITLFGKVTDMFEKPVPNATVTVVSVYGGISESDSTQTSENGSYRLDFVLAYQQNISVEKEGYPKKSWEKNFGSRMTEFNMHIDIDRSIPQGTAAGTISPDETNASRMQTRPAPVPLSASLVAMGIVFAAAGILRKK